MWGAGGRLAASPRPASEAQRVSKGWWPTAEGPTGAVKVRAPAGSSNDRCHRTGGGGGAWSQPREEGECDLVPGRGQTAAHPV